MSRIAAVHHGTDGQHRRRQHLPSAIVLALFSAWAVPGRAGAANLLDDILAASARLPPDLGLRQCLGIQGLGNFVRLPAIIGEQRVTVSAAAGYSPSTQGAYLGSGPADVAPPPFVQALLDAGAATRVPLAWVQRTREMRAVMPPLQDTGSSGAGGQRPGLPYDERKTVAKGEIYLVTGPDKVLFEKTQPGMLAPNPPSLDEPTVPDEARAMVDRGTPPSGVWPTGRVCYTPVPERVLEYTDVQERANGISEVSAAVLFRTERMPAWASDPRVIGATRPNMLPWEVVPILFRNHGDGWRYAALSSFLMIGTKSHIVGAE